MIINNQKNNKKNRGFTLIEAAIYMALFGILMGGAVVAAYNIFEGSGRAQTRAMIQEEGDFLLSKISWVLSGTQAVTAPNSSTMGSSLTVVKYDTSIGNPIVIFIPPGTFNLAMSTSSNPTWEILNNTNVRISNLLFYHTLSSGNGVDPETVQFSFTVSATTPNGQTISENFPTTTISLRK
jgi:type II secretory pathway pseudopilin PulG